MLTNRLSWSHIVGSGYLIVLLCVALHKPQPVQAAHNNTTNTKDHKTLRHKPQQTQAANSITEHKDHNATQHNLQPPQAVDSNTDYKEVQHNPPHVQTIRYKQSTRAYRQNQDKLEEQNLKDIQSHNKKLKLYRRHSHSNTSLSTQALVERIFHMVRNKSNFKELKKIFQANKFYVRAQDQEGRTALHWAVRVEWIEMIDFLLAHGANPNAFDKDFDTPLLWAAFEGAQDVVERLLVNGAVPFLNKRQNQRRTEGVLWAAVYSRNTHVLQALLNMHKSILWPELQSARQFALERGQMDMLWLLEDTLGMPRSLVTPPMPPLHTTRNMKLEKMSVYKKEHPPHPLIKHNYISDWLQANKGRTPYMTEDRIESLVDNDISSQPAVELKKQILSHHPKTFNETSSRGTRAILVNAISELLRPQKKSRLKSCTSLLR